MSSPQLSSRHLLPLACALSLVAGCSVPALLGGRFVPPEMVLNASKIAGLSLSDATLEFELAITNPNRFRLRIRAVHYRLRINGTAVGDGVANLGSTVAANGATVVAFPVSLPLETFTAAAGTAALSGEIPYEIEVSVSVGSLFAQRDVAITATSVLRLNLPLELAGGPRSPGPV